MCGATPGMERFDVVVVGAGPAGGQCARGLAQVGWRVLLVERFRDFSRNSFSSAGTPLETLDRFDLPDSVVGSWWNRLVVVTTGDRGDWHAEQPLGAVLDFGRLRQFLADQVQTHGGQVRLGCRYVAHQDTAEGVVVTLRHPQRGITETVLCRVLVDATGPARAILGRKDHPPMLTGTGVEYLLRVDADTYRANADTLTFLLGHRWIPRGYSWVFPMEANTLKVGAGVLNRQHRVVGEQKPLKHYIQLLIDEHLKPQHYEILNIHGETLRYSSGLQDTYADGRVLAIGDAVSTVNFLGGEGIRHGMVSAELAQEFIEPVLRGEKDGFDGYREAMHAHFLDRWNRSEYLGLKKYLEDSDRRVDRLVAYLRPLSLQDLVDVLFYYRFEKLSKGLLPYLRRKLWRLWQRFTAPPA
jgi:flavin-dependent dehydrogenase